MKERGEVDAIARRHRAGRRGLPGHPERGLVGRTEREVATSAVRQMEDLGAEGPSFPPIVAAGATARCRTPCRATWRFRADALVVVDMGARLDGYCSDCTRTFATGTLGDEAVEAYELVLRAQWPRWPRCARGPTCPRWTVWRGTSSRRRATASGSATASDTAWAWRCTRRRGSAQTASGTLEAGNVVTVEPGVYLPGEFGIRIEDLVAVTDGDPEVLTGFTKDLVTTD